MGTKPPRRKATNVQELGIFISPVIDRITGRMKVTITDQDGGVTDITNKILNWDDVSTTVEKGMDNISLALASIDGEWINNDGSFKWTGGEILRVWHNYEKVKADLVGEDKIFQGKMHHPTYNYSDGVATLNVFARKIPELQDRRRIIIYSPGTTHYSAIKTILNDYSDLIDTTLFDAALSGETTTFAASFDDSDLNIIGSIMRDANWSGRFDNDTSDDGVYAFDGFKDDGTKVNKLVAAVQGQNLLLIDNWGVRTEDVFTRVKIIGKSVAGANILWSETDENIENDLWRRDLSKSNNKITNRAEAQTEAATELSIVTGQNVQGIVSMVAHKDLEPGDYFRISAVDIGVNDFFKVIRIQRRLTNTFTMIIDVAEKFKNDVIGDLSDTNVEVQDLKIFENPNDMKFTFEFPFDDDTGLIQSSDLVFSDGKMKVEGGESSGLMTTVIFDVPNDVTHCDMVLEGPENVVNSRLFVSANSGNQEIEILITDENVLYTLPRSGKKLRIRMEVVGSSAAFAGLTVRFK